MNKTKLRSYAAPEIEVCDIVVEQGFAGSLGGVDLDPNNPGEIPSLPDLDTDW